MLCGGNSEGFLRQRTFDPVDTGFQGIRTVSIELLRSRSKARPGQARPGPSESNRIHVGTLWHGPLRHLRELSSELLRYHFWALVNQTLGNRVAGFLSVTLASLANGQMNHEDIQFQRTVQK